MRPDLHDTSMREPTERQLQVMAFIRDFREDHQMPPTRTEIAQHFGWRSPNAAEEHLQALHRKGFIKLIEGKSRGIRVCEV